MKKKCLFSAIAVVLFANLVFAQQKIDDKYYIEGTYSISDNDAYRLDNVKTSGIKIDGANYVQGTTFGNFEKGVKTVNGLKGDLVRFSFEKVTTDCADGFKMGFTFQEWNANRNKWVTDVEAVQGRALGYSEKTQLIMLVLDCSASMSGKFEQLKNDAIEFVQVISQTAEGGNVKIGVIGFAGMDYTENNTYPITPLTYDSRTDIVQFIKGLNPELGTSLYYSMDMATSMMVDYAKKNNLRASECNAPFVLTFTDGFDNASRKKELGKNLGKYENNLYFKYVKDEIVGGKRKIMGYPVECGIVAFKGTDIEPEDESIFKNLLNQLASPDHSSDFQHFWYADNFVAVADAFKKIAQGLVDRWQNINLYIPESKYGRVRWVLNCGEPEPEPSNFKFFLGFGGGLGFGYYDCYDYGYYGYYDYYDYGYYDYYYESDLTTCYLSLDVDFTIGLNERNFLGAQVGFNYGLSGGGIGFSFVPEWMFRFKNNTALMLGLGYRGWEYLCGGGADIHVGFKTKKPFFINGDIIVGNGADLGMRIGIGWGFFKGVK